MNRITNTKQSETDTLCCHNIRSFIRRHRSKELLGTTAHHKLFRKRNFLTVLRSFSNVTVGTFVYHVILPRVSMHRGSFDIWCCCGGGDVCCVFFGRDTAHSCLNTFNPRYAVDSRFTVFMPDVQDGRKWSDMAVTDCRHCASRGAPNPVQYVAVPVAEVEAERNQDFWPSGCSLLTDWTWFGRCIFRL